MSGPRRNLQNSGAPGRLTQISHRRYTHANTARTTHLKSIITLLRTHTIFFSPPDSTTSPPHARHANALPHTPRHGVRPQPLSRPRATPALRAIVTRREEGHVYATRVVLTSTQSTRKKRRGRTSQQRQQRRQLLLRPQEGPLQIPCHTPPALLHPSVPLLLLSYYPLYLYLVFASE